MVLHFVSTLPPWIRYIEGEAPLVLVAPHGGRRPADAPIQDSIKVNDLYTAELTAVLATRTRGYALINHALDRNELDLNRISQVRAHAQWFPLALAELLSALVAQHGTARVFFIHGWNVVQPVCDLGIGLKLRDNRLVPVGKATQTLSAAFFAEVVLPFWTAASTQGIDVAVGRRYPAADKNNFMQVFGSRFVEDSCLPIRTLAELAVQEKIDAVQLELGVGLRWPGPERDGFVEVFCGTLGRHTALLQRDGQEFSTLMLSPSKTVSHDRCAFPSLGRDPEPTRIGLHFHDPLSGLGVMGGIEFDRTAPTHAGRLLLSLGGTEMILFTGEDSASGDPNQVRIGGLVWRSQPDGIAITYHGTAMRFSHPQAFIRLEEGLASSWIEPVDIALYLTLPQLHAVPTSPLFLSRLQGEIRLCDRLCTIDAWGFVDMLKAEETGRLQPRRLLSLPFGPDLGIFLSWVETPSGSRSSGVIYHHGVPHPLQPGDWDLQYTLEQGRPTTFHLSLTPPTPLTLQCQGETLTAIPVVRHASQGSALAVTFGLSHTRWQGREARGVYEFSERLENLQETTRLFRSGKSDIADHLPGLTERGQGLAIKG